MVDCVLLARDAAVAECLPLTVHSLPRVAHPPADGWFLLADTDGLELHCAGSGLGGLRVDFLGGTMGFRLRHGGGRGQAVARAVGCRKGRPLPRVFDATAGLGRDAFLLAWLGCEVLAVEREPLIHALTADALRRAGEDAAVAARMEGRLDLRCGDACEVLESLSIPPEVVYLDPMHPPRRKSAAVRKEMQLLQRLLGEADESPPALGEFAAPNPPSEPGGTAGGRPLFEIAMSCGTPRVVVKRPRHGAPLGPGVSHEVVGRSTRFDVYLR